MKTYESFYTSVIIYILYLFKKKKKKHLLKLPILFLINVSAQTVDYSERNAKVMVHFQGNTWTENVYNEWSVFGWTHLLIIKVFFNKSVFERVLNERFCFSTLAFCFITKDLKLQIDDESNISDVCLYYGSIWVAIFNLKCNM